MNNSISNPKIEVPSGMNLNDKDYISNLLSDLKCMEKNFAVVLTEASNEELYNKYHEIFNKISILQREVYEVTFRHGWYILEKAELNKIDQKYQMLNQEHQQLNSNI